MSNLNDKANVSFRNTWKVAVLVMGGMPMVAISAPTLPRRAEEAMEQLVAPEGKERKAAIQAIVQAGHPGVIRRVFEMWEAYAGDVNFEEPVTQVIQAWGPTSVSLMVEAIRVERFETLRKRMVLFLGDARRDEEWPSGWKPFFRAPSVRDLWMKGLTDRDEHIRQASGAGLSDFSDEESCRALIKALADRHAFVRVASIQSLARRKENSGIPGLLQALRDADEDVRMIAVEELGKWNAAGHAGVLVKSYRDVAREVREQVLMALRKVREAKVDTMLEEAMLDPVASIRALAEEILLERDPRRRQRVLDRMKSGERIPKHALVAKPEQDPEFGHLNFHYGPDGKRFTGTSVSPPGDVAYGETTYQKGLPAKELMFLNTGELISEVRYTWAPGEGRGHTTTSYNFQGAKLIEHTQTPRLLETTYYSNGARRVEGFGNAVQITMRIGYAENGDVLWREPESKPVRLPSFKVDAEGRPYSGPGDYWEWVETSPRVTYVNQTEYRDGWVSHMVAWRNGVKYGETFYQRGEKIKDVEFHINGQKALECDRIHGKRIARAKWDVQGRLVARWNEQGHLIEGRE